MGSSWIQSVTGRWECWERTYGHGITATTMRTRDAVAHRVDISLRLSSRLHHRISLSTSLCGETYPTASAARMAADDVASGLMAIIHHRQQADHSHPDLSDRKAAYDQAVRIVYRLGPIQLDKVQGQVRSMADVMEVLGWSRDDAAEAHREYIQTIRDRMDV